MAKEKLKVYVNGEKKWYQSKVIRANIFALVCALLLALSGEYTASGILTVPSVINILLRVITKYPIKFDF